MESNPRSSQPVTEHGRGAKVGQFCAMVVKGPFSQVGGGGAVPMGLTKTVQPLSQPGVLLIQFSFLLLYLSHICPSSGPPTLSTASHHVLPEGSKCI